MERRLRRRIGGSALAAFQVFLDDDEHIDGRLVDISETGLQFRLHRAEYLHAMQGAILPGILNGPVLEEEIRFDGRILWIRDEEEWSFTGVEFIEPVDLPMAMLALSMSEE